MSDQVSNFNDIAAQVAARVATEAAFLPVPAPVVEPAPAEITDEFISECLEANELGDGRMFALMHRGEFVNVKKWDKKPWLKYQGHHWAKDEMGEVMTAVDPVAAQYSKYGESFAVPIKRVKEQMSEANARISIATKRIQAINRQSEPDTAALMIQNEEISEATADSGRFEEELKSLQRKQKDAFGRAKKIRSVSGAVSCLTWAAHTEQPLAITGKELDRQPWLLACPNTVVNLQTGTWRSGKPDDYLVRTVNVDFPLHLGEAAINHFLIHGSLPDGSSPCPNWHKFKLSIQPDNEVLACMDRIIGYAITGHARMEQFVAVYVGRGRNGKGVYFDTIWDIMGDLAWTIKPEFIMEDKNSRSAGAASPEMMMIAGRRMVRASETEENQKIAAGKLKSITGGNKQNARGLFVGDEENIESTWSLFLETNEIPLGLTKDFALMQRLIIIEFPWLFVDDIAEESQKEPHNADRFRIKDKKLYDTLQLERPGILLDLIRCCLLWQAAKGINPPERLKVRLEEQKTKEDTLLQFLHCRCLMDWEPLRTYGEGQVSNIPAGNVGERYRCITTTSKNQHPQQHPEAWHYEGPGMLLEHPVEFSEFYAVFKKWYSDEVSDNEKYRPSKKAVSKQLRDKGLDVRAKGAGTRIWGGIEVVTIIA